MQAENMIVNVDKDEIVKVSIVKEIDGQMKRVFWLEASPVEDSIVILKDCFEQHECWARSYENGLSEAEDR